MQVIIQRAGSLFTRLTGLGAALCMALLFLIVFINAVRRYTIGKSFEWGEELPIFIAIYGVMFGMALAYIQDRHIRFTLLVGILSKKWTHRLYLFVDLLMVLNGLLLAYSGWMFTLKRGGVEVSGLIHLAKSLREITGWSNMILLGHHYPYQAALILGGILLGCAALLKFFIRLGRIPAESMRD